MSSRISIPVPVWPSSKIGAKLETLPVVDVDIPAIRRSEAPVALRVDTGRQRNPITEYRLHAGEFYIPALPDKSLTGEDLERMIRIPSQFSQVQVNELNALGWYGVFQAHADANYTSPKRLLRGARMTEAGRDHCMKVVQPFLDRLLAIDGEIWVRNRGPVIGVHWMGHEARIPALEVMAQRLERGVVDRRSLTFAALDRPAAERALDEVYGGHVIGGRLERIIDVPADDRILFEAVERAVWHFLFEARMRPPSNGDRPLVETILAAREVLGRRWPGVELEYIAKLHAQSGKHLDVHDAPPPDDLEEVLERMVEVGEGRFARTVVDSWRLALVRTRHWMERSLEDDRVLSRIGDLAGM